MKTKHLFISSLLAIMTQLSHGDTVTEAPPSTKQNPSCPAYLNHDFKMLHSSKTLNLCALYNRKPILIVNTASHCGFTPQFKGLEALHKKYKAKGLQVIGFASNSFKQAAKSEEEAATVCYKNYGVSFTMLSATDVKGKNANPVFKALAAQSREPKWNFNKYLISNDGHKVDWFGSRTAPDSTELISKIEAALH